MTSSHVTAFDKTLQTTHRWLAEIASDLGWDSEQQAYLALRAVLHTLRDRLPANEAVDLAAQLPMLVRGFYFEGWYLADKPLRYRHKQDFMDRVAKAAPGIGPVDLERATVSVFRRLSNELGGGEVDQVRNSLPAEIRELWATAGL